jgi:hypothetical protein
MIISGKCTRCGAFSYTGGQSKNSPPAKGNTIISAKNYTPMRLMTAEQWKNLTSVTFSPRSPLLKAIDRSLNRYEIDSSYNAYQSVNEAFYSWVSRKDGINSALMSRRNHSKSIQYLADQLAGKPVRIPGDLPAFMDILPTNWRANRSGFPAICRRSWSPAWSTPAGGSFTCSARVALTATSSASCWKAAFP